MRSGRSRSARRRGVGARLRRHRRTGRGARPRVFRGLGRCGRIAVALPRRSHAHRRGARLGAIGPRSSAPMEVGRRFFLVPEWRDDPAPPGRFRIAVNPGMAFGTGVHETTRLALEALEEFVKPGMTVLDVGTGSGILAKAARLLGAARVYACDTDPVAVEIAGDGFIGSVNAVATASVDLAVANISPEAIVQLAPDLLRVLRKGGVLLVSGFELAEVEQVKAALPHARDVRKKGNWALIVTSVC